MHRWITEQKLQCVVWYTVWSMQKTCDQSIVCSIDMNPRAIDCQIKHTERLLIYTWNVEYKQSTDF